ncbi:CPBP family intramembrane metalloprotease [Candidatus Uhrbacteria bacterium]|nr:CPBP family intramembrane metalloprotease [Candidatus Uhrbacteria bacterium]
MRQPKPASAFWTDAPAPTVGRRAVTAPAIPRISPLGIWSAVGTYAAILTIAILVPSSGTTIRSLIAFLSGHGPVFDHGAESFLATIAGIFAILAIKIPANIATGLGAQIVAGESGVHAVQKYFHGALPHGSYLRTFFLVTFLEELFARWFFLGVLTKIPALSGTGAFYALVLIGNGIWAAAHLVNYRDPRDRRLIRVLPQFISGLCYSFLFVRYGLAAAVLAHFASNAVIFATHKRQRFGAVDVCFILLALLSLIIGSALLRHPVSELTIWFTNGEAYAVPGWTLRDYLGLSLMCSGALGFCFDLLCYDRNLPRRSDVRSWALHPIATIVGLGIMLIAVLTLTLAITYALYELLGTVIDDVPIRILVIAIFFASASTKSTSLSGAMRAFWISVPGTYLFVYIANALGFWGALGYLGISSLLALPSLVLMYIDD